MSLAGPAYGLVLAELVAGDRASRTAERAEHREIVAEEAFGRVRLKLGEKVENRSVVPQCKPLEHLTVGCSCGGGTDVLVGVGGFVVAELSERPEPVAQPAAG